LRNGKKQKIWMDVQSGRGIKERTFDKWGNKKPEESRQFVEVGKEREKATEQGLAELVSGS
jgi:hypothetical protein